MNNYAVGFNSMNNEGVGGCGSCGNPQQSGGRKLSAYNLFVKERMKVLRKEYPAKKVTELMPMIAAKWKQQKGKSSSKSKSASSKSRNTKSRTHKRK